MNKIPIYIQETDQTANNYDGSSYISAGYAMFNFPLEKSFKVIGGFRYESTNLHVKSFNPLIPDGLIQTNDFLPSLSLVFSPKENINIRASYGKTLARPTFREISPFMSYDFNGGDTYIGNPSIKRSLIDNGDIRFEWYLKAGEIIAVSAYYKKFVNPIEKVIVDATNKVLSWQNVNKADIYGLEFEFRKRLLFLGDFFSNITLGGNFSYTQSRVQIPQAELSELRVYEPAAKDYRPFQGQSPYIVNLFADYDDYSNGISASLYYNTFGKRLYAIGSIGAPDIYEEPFAMLNFTFSKRLFSNIHLKVSAKNLLDTKQLRTQEFKSHKYVYNSHRYGSVFSVGIKYSIQ
jgi:TonB-dependent receptor